MKYTKLLLIITVALALSQPLLAQDSTSKVRPASIVKLSIGNPIMYLLYPRFGMKYIGVGYEWFRNSKTSFNGYLDYYHIQDGSFNNPASYNYHWQLDNSGTKNMVSLRTLYKWYPLHKIKYARGLYVAGGVNAVLRHTNYTRDATWGSFSTIDLYAGLGYGIGYRIEVRKKLSLEVFYHKASNGVALQSLLLKDRYDPIGIDLLDFSIGYVLSKKSK